MRLKHCKYNIRAHTMRQLRQCECVNPVATETQQEHCKPTVSTVCWRLVEAIAHQAFELP